MIDWETVEARAAEVLAGDCPSPAGIHIIQGTGSAPVVAALLVPRDSGTLLAILLREGRNLVESGDVFPDFREEERSALRGVLEGAQWRIIIKANSTTVQDIGSTNGAVLVRRSDRSAYPGGLLELQELPGTLRLGWDGMKKNGQPECLYPGDLLINTYGPMLYWRRAAEQADEAGPAAGTP
jgi:hypothetical protein